MIVDEDGHRPDAFEKRLRFGCGFLFGVVVVAYMLLRQLFEPSGTFWAVGAGVAVVCGVLAVRWGDRFWRVAVSWWWPW